MKKVIAMLSCAALIFSVGCASTESNSESKPYSSVYSEAPRSVLIEYGTNGFMKFSVGEMTYTVDQGVWKISPLAIEGENASYEYIEDLSIFVSIGKEKTLTGNFIDENTDQEDVATNIKLGSPDAEIEMGEISGYPSVTGISKGEENATSGDVQVSSATTCIIYNGAVYTFSMIVPGDIENYMDEFDKLVQSATFGAVTSATSQSASTAATTTSAAEESAAE